MKELVEEMEASMAMMMELVTQVRQANAYELVLGVHSDTNGAGRGFWNAESCGGSGKTPEHCAQMNAWQAPGRPQSWL